MKRYFLVLTLLVFNILHADLDEGLDDNRDISWIGAYKNQPTNFFNVELNYDNISKSNFTTPSNLGQEIGFSTFTAIGSYYAFFNCTEAVGLGLGYSRQTIDWDNNPFFEQEGFDHLVVDIGAFSTRFDGWLFRALFRTRFNTENFGGSYSTVYMFTVWGRYEVRCDSYIHLGVITEWGLRRSKIWPIIGFETHLTDCIKLNLIYPLDISLRYFFHNNWYVGVASSFFYYRDRLKKNETLSHGFLEYRNTGVEAQVGYEWCPIIKGDIHVGHAFGNEIKLSNAQNEQATHHKFKAAFYFGGRIEFKF